MALTIGKRLLIVDDSELVVTMLADHLESEGFDILVANDGQQGYERVLADKPDLVITDVQMPRMSGLDLTRKLRENESTRPLPIVMITTLNTMDDRMAGIEAGADDLINKPFNKQMLLLKIRNLLKASALNRQVQSNYEEMKAVNAELDKLQKKHKYWMEVVGEEIKEVAANLQMTLGKLQGEMASCPESAQKVAKYAFDYARTLADRLDKVFKEDKSA
ncbi:MAG: response regulator [Candidatus Wallbacteria bacterium]|nr:response regulator [Candidatus Wallbacteria bacterium]